MSKIAKEVLAVAVVVGKMIVDLVEGGLVGFPVDSETPGALLEIRCTAVAEAAAVAAAAAEIAAVAAVAVEPAALEIQFAGTPYTPLAEVPS